jgi:putative iron-regulated protein
LRPTSPNQSPLIFVANTADGEGGEGGGESGSGSGTPQTYVLPSASASPPKFNSKPQVEAYAALVHETYAASRAAAEKLSLAVDALVAEPTETTLATARKAWVEARPAYLKSEAFRFYDGPIENIEGDINAWPMNEAYVDYVEGKPDAGMINSKETLYIGVLTSRNQESDEANVTTGWHAVEFLLWGQDLSATGPGNRPYTDYVADQGNNNRRRAYLAAVTSKLVSDIGILETAWAPNVKYNYRDIFQKLEQPESLGRMINGIAILAGFEIMSERLGVALDSGDQEDEHSCFSDTTKQDFVYNLAGIKEVWHRAKLDELVASQDTALSREVTEMLQDAETKINKLSDPWDQVLASPKNSAMRADAEAVVSALQALADGFKKVGDRLGVVVLIPVG